VVIPSGNRPDLLGCCLDAVTRHAPPGAEILVVDDGSPGGATSAVAGQFGVRALRRDRPGGFCAAANAGLRAARSRVVELLNDDTEVTVGWAEAALARFAEPGVAAVAPLVLVGPPGGDCVPRVDSAGDRYFAGGVAGKRGHRRPVVPEVLVGGEVFGASAACAFYDRDAVLAVGGFPEEFGAYFEDVDLSFRLHWAGHRVVYEPGSRVWHRIGASHGPPRRRLLEQQSRNEERVFWRNLPRGALARALPWHLAVLAAKARRRWREGALAPWLCGRLRVLGEWRQVARHRRRLHAMCARPDPAVWGVEGRFWGGVA
jgi:GT2 family glycosyltransferase